VKGQPTTQGGLLISRGRGKASQYNVPVRSGHKTVKNVEDSCRKDCEKAGEQEEKGAS